MRCRLCDATLSRVFVDLGEQPSANCFLTSAQLREAEPVFPLRVYICDACLLVQLPETHKASDIFTDGYVYFSSYSKSWVEHARRYVELAIPKFGLDEGSRVIEIASNDGYLLQHFVARGIPCLGVDPAADAARAAESKGVKTHVGFFGSDLARRLTKELGRADLIVGNNVLAHVPGLNDFIAGLALLLKPGGTITMEFPHLLRLIEGLQFDTIYDEHFSYFSLQTACAAFRRHGLEIYDVEELPTHGGSLRIYVGLERRAGAAVTDVRAREREAGLDRVSGYEGFQPKVAAIRDRFRALIAGERAQGRKIAAFGAAAKGNTFLNTCRVGHDAIAFVVDDTPAKQGKYLPGSRIPVVAEAAIRASRPDLILILPWNVKAEIMAKLSYVRDWGCRFMTCIPEVSVV